MCRGDAELAAAGRSLRAGSRWHSAPPLASRDLRAPRRGTPCRRSRRACEATTSRRAVSASPARSSRCLAPAGRGTAPHRGGGLGPSRAEVVRKGHRRRKPRIRFAVGVNRGFGRGVLPAGNRHALRTFQPRRAKNRWGGLFCQLPAGDQRQSGAGDPQDHPRLADGLDEEQSEARGLGSPEQPGGTRLDELLRALLSVEVRSGASPPEQGPCALGAMEIQTVQTPGASVDVLVGTHCATGPEVVRPAAARRAAGGWRARAG